MKDEQVTNDIESLVSDSSSYETWFLSVLNSVVFRGKTLEEWEEELRLPDASSSINLEVLEEFNNKLLNITQVIGRNLATARSVHLQAESKHQIAMLLAREEILEKLPAVQRAPSAESLEKLSELKCLESLKLKLISETIFEFWNTHSFKCNRLNERITSLNILKKMG